MNLSSGNFSANHGKQSVKIGFYSAQRRFPWLLGHFGSGTRTLDVSIGNLFANVSGMFSGAYSMTFWIASGISFFQ